MSRKMSKKANARAVKERLDNHLRQAKKGRPMKALGSAMIRAMLSPTGDSKHFNRSYAR